MVLVVGSTGMLGQEICRLLSAKNIKFRALIRKDSDPEKIKTLSRLGAELATGDLKDPASLEKACRGVEKIISTASSTYSRREGDTIRTVDRDGQIALVKEAEKAGVKRFVFISFAQHPTISSPLSEAKRAVEQTLMESKLNWCSLQASWFMEVWLSPAVGFDYVNRSVRIYGSGEEPISWVSYQDVASFAVEALDHPLAERTILPIGGPKPVTPNEVVRIFEKRHGASFAVEHIPKAVLEQQQNSADNELQASFIALMRCYADGVPLDMEGILRHIPVKLTSVEDYAEAVKTKNVVAG